MFIEWNSTLDLGIKILDDQHKKLVGYINEFHDGFKNNESHEAMMKLFKQLVMYTETHFKAEERYFERYGYESSDTHVKEHIDFVDKIKELDQKLKSGEQVLSMEVLFFLKRWINDHIKVKDKAYIDCFKQAGL